LAFFFFAPFFLAFLAFFDFFAALRFFAINVTSFLDKIVQHGAALSKEFFALLDNFGSGTYLRGDGRAAPCNPFFDSEGVIHPSIETDSASTMFCQGQTIDTPVERRSMCRRLANVHGTRSTGLKRVDHPGGRGNTKMLQK